MTTRYDLNGQWDFVADLDPKYHDDPRIYATPAFADPRANRRHWLKVPVPGVWQKYGERYDVYEGVCWFAREFEVPDLPAGATARLRFGAVNYRCRVFVNGGEVGAHEGGYTEFTLAVTDRLKPGRNHVAVMVDNRATTIKWPPCLGYFNYGGIHRGVSLEVLAGPCLDGVTLTATADEQGWHLLVGGRILNPEAALIARIRNGDGLSWEDPAGDDGVLAVRVPFFDTPSWSPETPHLEPITVELLNAGHEVLDQREFAFGFRTVAMREGQVQFNGQPYRLKGLCYVYDSPVHGLVMAPEQVETDLRLMKEAGCNAVRCHYPMDEAFYAACDRLGLLVWVEPPVYCYHPRDHETNTRFADPAWLALAQQMAREMIAVARNHPSVALYSIGNECNTQHPEAAPFFRALAGTIREQDPTRLISYAALYGIVGPITEVVDVLGVNSYWGWYDRIWAAREPPAGATDAVAPREPIDLAPLRKMLDQVLAQRSDLALLLTEFGADSVPGFYSRSRDLWSEEYHADLLRAIFAVAAEYPRIVGTFPFGFSDYRDPSKVQNGYWDELNLKGVVGYGRQKKLAFTALQEQYTPRG